jgi:protein SCO1/2
MERRVLLSFVLLVVAPLWIACSSAKNYAAHGVVITLLPEDDQLVVAHDDIPGFMPAMTMNFYVADPKLFKNLEPGAEIDFVLEVNGSRYKITQIKVTGQVSLGEEWSLLGRTLVRSDPAPPFSLVDEEGNALRMSDLSGKNILLDFIFTRCTGPCPILTSTHVSVQSELSERAQKQTHFVSITLDPKNDSPEVLDTYARERGADLANWSFLTGSPESIDAVVSAYGVASSPGEDGQMEHLVVTFLIDSNGRIVKRYMGQGPPSKEVTADLESLAS